MTYDVFDLAREHHDRGATIRMEQGEQNDFLYLDVEYLDDGPAVEFAFVCHDRFDHARVRDAEGRITEHIEEALSVLKGRGRAT